MALRQINIIPSDIIAKNILARHSWFWTKGFICISVLFLIFYLGQSYWLAGQQTSHPLNTPMSKEISGKINQTLQDAEKIKIEMQNLNLKTRLFSGLSNRQYYFDILAVLADSFNDATWINNLTIQKYNKKESDSSSIMINGISMAHNTLAAFLESLSSIPIMQDVSLVFAKNIDQKSSTSSDLDLSNAVQFQVSCSILKAQLK